MMITDRVPTLFLVVRFAQVVGQMQKKHPELKETYKVRYIPANAQHYLDRRFVPLITPLMSTPVC